MLLVLSDEHKEHLGFLPEVDSAVVGEFGRIAVEFLRKGSNPKIYEGAASKSSSASLICIKLFMYHIIFMPVQTCLALTGKLNVTAEIVQHGVEGLMYLLSESSKLMISEVDFQDSVLVLGFSEELNKLLLQLYLENRKEIRLILSELAPSMPHYHNLEWRLDAQLASRALRQQVKPVLNLKLQLDDNGTRRTHLLQTDPATLLHLIQELERALAEVKTNHCRRILRNIK
uniref:COMM domain containing 2 n=1 Tax=Paramormyrops kingsleyae TaxID=1676925 RepID=A0A3B3QSS4_9TELE